MVGGRGGINLTHVFVTHAYGYSKYLEPLPASVCDSVF